MDLTIEQVKNNDELLQKVLNTYNSIKRTERKYYERNKDKIINNAKEQYNKKKENHPKEPKIKKTEDKKQYMKEYMKQYKIKKLQNKTE
jgi:ABC-type phosphate transport system substrate-binding protein